ncbi:MAG: homoserine kinase [Patescibacteria group bacterium]
MEIESILRHYHVGTVTSVVPLSVGAIHETHKITTETGIYIARIFEAEKDESAIAFEMTVLQYLAKNNFIAPKPVETIDGRLYGRENNYFALYDYIPGHALKGPELSIDHVHSVGETLGWFHELLSNYHVPEKKPRLDWQAVWAKYEQLEKSSPRSDGAETFNRIQKALLESRLPESLPTGIIHGDLHEQNVVFRHGHVSGVLDFDQCAYGTIIADVATEIVWWCFRDTLYHAHLAQAFLKGYQSQRTITSEEIQSLWLALKLAITRLELIAREREQRSREQFETYSTRSDQITPKYFQTIYSYVLEKKERILDSWSFLL